mmetsp:Transcript_17249/g.27875  ORF Transcript_17249/g.27875 Transcript_17249/m.27875 type:complete len:548 (-) Transcript_17249:538-2181(-)|eukprot:CAMPEP_0203760988 /NCGR_PEP_ID=MMETSP0098-20131031/14170_1 /ASSEMBLY_ACC=CAM_ASM_000208 /TAXON_ID=96639 /ORGANISM=" , Strain NY0313808BC1" /LENGTH=547 /DNA_ID=CAMNT_0050654787 /DNA_START=546 /DNA_END=2189 /DNA_ORIENTATION=-
MGFDWGKVLGRKPLEAFRGENETSVLKPNYGLGSLFAIAIGGMVGSGIFVLNGTIAATLAGPGTGLCWIIAGLCCTVTAFAYCELAALLVSSGSTYAFCYYGLGEIFASIAAMILLLDYGVASAAVARSWGDKLAFWFIANGWIDCESPTNCWLNAINGTCINFAACFLSAFMIGIILLGVKIEKRVVVVIVGLKVLLVIFVIAVGAYYTNASNLTPFVPANGELHNGTYSSDFEGGVPGVLLGTTQAFFGYIGFDEVTCMAGEAKRPKRDIPIVILGSIAFVGVLYLGASLVLTGMVPYDQIDVNEGFGSAFQKVGADWAMQITLVGEIFIVLPAVVLVGYVPLGRILYSISGDGHLPPIFRSVNKHGTLFNGTLIAGIILSLIVMFTPFSYLSDLISGGMLFGFVLTNSSLILTRTQNRGKMPLAIMVFSVLGLCLIVNKINISHSVLAMIFVALLGVVAIGAFACLAYFHEFTTDIESFQAPMVPYVPALAICLNWFLFAQLSWTGLAMVLGLVAIGLMFYFLYGNGHSVGYHATDEKTYPRSV